MTEQPAKIAALVRRLLTVRLTPEDWAEARQRLGEISDALDGGDGDIEVAVLSLKHLLGDRLLTGRANTMMDDRAAQEADDPTREVGNVLITRLGIEGGAVEPAGPGKSGPGPAGR